MNTSEMRACRILNIWQQDTIIPHKLIILIFDKIKGSFKKETKKKTAVSPSTLYRVSQVQKNQTLELGILSENLKREAAKQTYISYERQ